MKKFQITTDPTVEADVAEKADLGGAPASSSGVEWVGAHQPSTSLEFAAGRGGGDGNVHQLGESDFDSESSSEEEGGAARALRQPRTPVPAAQPRVDIPIFSSSESEDSSDAENDESSSDEELAGTEGAAAAS